jgi:hypothetical protein
MEAPRATAILRRVCRMLQNAVAQPTYKYRTSVFGLRNHEMRTTLAELASDRRGNDAAHDEQPFARDNPRRRRERHNEREDDDRHGSGVSRSPLRHFVQHTDDRRRRASREHAL